MLDRVSSPNGNGNGHSNGNGNGHGSASNVPPSSSASFDLSAVQPLIAEASAILTSYLTAEERAALTVRAGIERVLTLARADQQAALLKVQGLLALLPFVGEQTIEQVLAV